MIAAICVPLIGQDFGWNFSLNVTPRKLCIHIL
jgi:hypothetical protein